MMSIEGVIILVSTSFESMTIILTKRDIEGDEEIKGWGRNIYIISNMELVNNKTFIYYFLN